jgi:WD40 repeat protein
MEQLAKRWYRPPIMKVFVDKTSIPVGPLWSRIEYGLTRSKWLILMASPEAAESRWVGDEVNWWMTHRSLDNLIIVHTAGVLRWDRDLNDFTADSDAIPARLRGKFDHVPRWETVPREDRSPKNVESTVLSVTSAVRQIDIHELSSQAYREHRRTMRVRRGAIIVLAMLTVIALVAAGFAFVQRGEAIRQRQEAIRQRDAAIALHLVSDATDMLAQRTFGGDVQAFNKLLAAHALSGGDAVDGGLQDAIMQRQTTAKIVDIVGQVGFMAFSPNGHRLVTVDKGDDNVMRLRFWDADSGRMNGAPVTLNNHPSALDLISPRVAFSPDGRRLATFGRSETGEAVNLWSVETGQPVGPRLTGFSDEMVQNVAFSPDGYRLASASENGTLRFFNADTGELLSTTRLAWNPATNRAAFPRVFIDALVFSPDLHRVATGSQAGLVQLWNADTGQPISPPLTTMNGRAVNLPPFAFSPDGHYLAASNGGSTDVGLWNADTGESVRASLAGHTGPVVDVAFSPDGQRLAATSTDKTLRLWDTGTGQLMGDPLIGHSASVFRPTFSPDGQLLATLSVDHTLRIWNLNAGQPLTGPTQGVSDVAFSPDSHRIAAIGSDGVWLWDVDTRKTDRPPVTQSFDGYFEQVAFSPDGQRIIVEDGASVWIWNLDTNETINHPLTFRGMLNATAVSRDGKRIATAYYPDRPPTEPPKRSIPTLEVWDADTGQPLKSWPAGSTPAESAPLTSGFSVTSMAFSPDTRRLASGDSHGTVQIWDVDTAKLLVTLKGNNDAIDGIAFSLDGNQVATANYDGTVDSYDIGTSDHLSRQLTGHTSYVISVAVSPDRRRLASGGGDLKSGGGDHTVRFWDAVTGKPVGQPLTGHSRSVMTVTFSPDGRWLASGGLDSMVRLWPAAADPQSLCDKLTTNMSHKQWRDWVSPDIDYPSPPLCSGLPVPPD